MILLLWLQSASAGGLHPVRDGDTLASIAAKAGTTVEVIRAMNKLGKRSKPAIGTLLLLPDPPGHFGEQQAFLISLTGQGSFTTGDGEVRAATPWSPVPSGTKICTETGAYATLRLASECDETGSQVDDLVLDSDTCVVVESAFSSEAGRSSVVRVEQGTVSVAHAADARGHITLKTEAGLTTGSQGGYRVTVADEAARTEALFSEVAVQGAGEEVGLAAGQGSRTIKGEPPSPAVDLLKMGPLIAPGEDAPLRQPSFTWTEVQEAFGYRFEIATDDQFRDVIFATDVEQARYDAPVLMLPVGRVDATFWRVASFDRLGFLSIPTPPRRLGYPTGVAPKSL